MIFKQPKDFLDWDQQKLRYDNHENAIETPGYKEYFEQLLKPLRTFLKPGQRGLDWGAGPGPVLAQLLSFEGLQMQIYDPVYHPAKPTGLFDVITSTEAIEHFQQPAQSLSEIGSFLKSQGIFAGLTQFHSGPEKFADWWYPRDPTHVVFYSEETFRRWADLQDYKILKLQSPVFIFQKL
ncbi:MAG: class I SAM-dependent methyltransferase [Pseudobdellovibrionaceae bacterium]